MQLELAARIRDLALFNLAIDSKLRGGDLGRMRVAEVASAGQPSGAPLVSLLQDGKGDLRPGIW